MELGKNGYVIIYDVEASRENLTAIQNILQRQGFLKKCDMKTTLIATYSIRDLPEIVTAPIVEALQAVVAEEKVIVYIPDEPIQDEYLQYNPMNRNLRRAEVEATLIPHHHLMVPPTHNELPPRHDKVHMMDLQPTQAPPVHQSISTYLHSPVFKQPSLSQQTSTIPFSRSRLTPALSRRFPFSPPSSISSRASSSAIPSTPYTSPEASDMSHVDAWDTISMLPWKPFQYFLPPIYKHPMSLSPVSPSTQRRAPRSFNPPNPGSLPYISPATPIFPYPFAFFPPPKSIYPSPTAQDMSKAIPSAKTRPPATPSVVLPPVSVDRGPATLAKVNRLGRVLSEMSFRDDATSSSTPPSKSHCFSNKCTLCIRTRNETNVYANRFSSGVPWKTMRYGLHAFSTDRKNGVPTVPKTTESSYIQRGKVNPKTKPADRGQRGTRMRGHKGRRGNWQDSEPVQ